MEKEELTSGSRRGAPQRALTAKGRQKVRKIGKAMAALGFRFDEVLSSPYRRARETAEIVVEQLRRPKVRFFPELVPSGKFPALIAELGKLQPSTHDILLVGHEPYLSQLISLLVFGKSAGEIALKKGGLCKMSCLSLREGKWATLEWLLTPKQMVMMR